MHWFWIAIIGYAFLAVVFVLDKLILTKSLEKPVLYTFYSTIFMFAALFAWPFGVTFLNTAFDWAIAIVSGLAFGFGLWTTFIAVKKGEASHINPFVGAVVTISTYWLSSLFLLESLSTSQISGIGVLILASFLLAFKKDAHHHKMGTAFAWGIASGIFFALSHVSAKFLYELYPFVTAFVWTRATTGLVGLLCLFYPAVRNSFKKKDSQEKKKFAKRHAFSIVVLDKILGVAAVVLIQFAIAHGSVTIVNALSGLQYVFMFVLIYLSTRLMPRVFKEDFTKKELYIEIVALLLVCMGSALFVW